MKIKHIIREAVKAEFGRRGLLLADVARRHGWTRQHLSRLLAEPLTGKRVAVAMRLVGMDRAHFEDLLLREWRRALDAGGEVVPPLIRWQTKAVVPVDGRVEVRV